MGAGPCCLENEVAGQGDMVSLGTHQAPTKPQAQTGGRVPPSPTALQECTGQQERGCFLQLILKASPGEGTGRTQKGWRPRWKGQGRLRGRGQ